MLLAPSTATLITNQRNETRGKRAVTSAPTTLPIPVKVISQPNASSLPQLTSASFGNTTL